MNLHSRLLVVSFCAAGALAALSGCASNVNTVERAQSQATPEYVADKRVITDNSLARHLQIKSINQTTVSGNLLKIQATLENLRNDPHTIRYKFEWVDQAGMTVNSPNETWKTLILQGRETTTISSVSLNPRAVDFILKLSE